MKNKVNFVKQSAIILFVALLVFVTPVFGASVNVEVQGDGYVDSYPSGILCGAACSETYSSSTRLTLTAHPNAGATFVRWGGCDTFTSTTCTIDLNIDRAVVATFSGEVKTEYNLRVYRSGSPGVVQSNPFAIYCGSICTYDEAKFEAGSTVEVIASPNPGYVFAGWSGDCSGASPTCTLTINSAKTVTASFDTAGSNTTGGYSVTVQKTGAGSGTVTSSDRKINCGTACSTSYNNGDSTTLTAVGAPGSTFTKWSGACTGTRNTCTLNINSAKTVTAEFSSTAYTYNLQIATSTTPKGGGKVVSTDGKANCQTCSVQFPENSNITLTAVPSSGAVVFDSWAGDFCNGLKQPTCSFTMPAATKSINANFKALYNLSIEKRGPGQGIVKTADNLLNCGPVCLTTQLESTEITLEARPERRAIFTGWSGSACSQAGNSTSCTVTFNVDKQVVATFDHYLLPLTIQKTGPGTIASEDNKINCGAACNAKYLLDSQIQLKQTTEPNSRFKGWGGKCSGLGETCEFDISEGANEVSAKFVPLYSLSVVNKHNRVAKTYTGINCGDRGSKTNTAKNCLLQQLEGGTNVEIFLEGQGSAQWSGCDSRVIGKCIVQMNKNKEIVISMPAGEEASLVKQALARVFPQSGAMEYVQNENNLPFRKTLEDLQVLKMGHNLQEIESWMLDNLSWYMTQGGVQTALNNWQKSSAKQVLLEVFASEVSQYPTLAAFLSDENQKPFQHALADLKEGRGDGGKDGLKQWISQSNNRQWYFDATGIGSHIAEIERQLLEAEIAAKRPSISSISPEGGRIGRPAKIVGKFHDVQLVTVNDDAVYFVVDSESLITLPNVHWGVDPQGVKINTAGNVNVITKWGSASAALISPSQPVLYNANGAKESCFPGVGKGCDGAGGAVQSILRGIGTQIGCEDPKPDGSKICWISTGSIIHDNCCVRYPSGRQCGGPGTDGKPAEDNNHDGNCDIEWQSAVWDTFWRKAWRTTYFPNQEFNLAPSGRSLNNRYPEGEAISSLEYCAPSGHELREQDLGAFCCSGRFSSGKKCS